MSQPRIDAWNSDNLPIYEPGLDEVVKQVRGKNLFFTTDIKEAVRTSEIIFVAVNTPTKEYGFGKGRAADLTYWEGAARSISQATTEDSALFKGSKIIVEKSTVPVSTADAMTCVLQANAPPGVNFQVLSNPEFLAEGTAVPDLMEPDRVLVGGPPTEQGRLAVAALVSVYAKWVAAERIISANTWSAELSKLIANAFLAQRISSVNALSIICEASGADIEHVMSAVGSDPGIGSKFLKCGPGFGGSCFQKDILNLVYLAETAGLPEVAEYWMNVIKMNDHQKLRFGKLIVSKMFNTVNNKKVAVLGFAFKADTGDTRESPAIDICTTLLGENAQVSIFDPKATEDQIRRDLSDANCARLTVAKDAYEACAGAHAVVVVTEWKEFKSLDFEAIFAAMMKPTFLFDGRNILDHQKLQEMGFLVHAIGKPETWTWRTESR
uniref:UDP-glucose 6-dehydrogenase n=1 Tax=Cryptomonas curvata TaxID=233186 RepID=A0A7S0NAX3_9CRYP